MVSVEYRLAPETPHPGPVEDCYAGLVWIAEHADELGIDPERIVAGRRQRRRRAGRRLGLLARDRGGPALAGQLLMCPMLDDRNDTPSAHQMAGLPMWNRQANEVGWTALLGAAAVARTSPVRRAGPGRGPLRPAADVHRRRVGRHLP